MRIHVKQLDHGNIGQIVEFKPEQVDGAPINVLGTLQAIELYSHGYALVVGGETYEMSSNDPVDISRSVELQNIKAMWGLLDELDAERLAVRLERAVEQSMRDEILGAQGVAINGGTDARHPGL